MDDLRLAPPPPENQRLRLKLVRVICTDPHATDSSSSASSDDDDDDTLHSSTSCSSSSFHVHSKRFVHEIALPPPASPSSSSTASSSMTLSDSHPQPQLHMYCSRRPAPRRPIISRRKARKKVVSLKGLDAQQSAAPTTTRRQQQYGDELGHNYKLFPSWASDPIHALKFELDSDAAPAGDSLIGDQRLHLPCHFLSEESLINAAAGVDAVRFLGDHSHVFISAAMNRIGHDTTDETSMKPDHGFSEIQDLELDSEAIAWLNSLQNLA